MQKYRELQEPCKSAIAEGKCLGCTGLAERDWKEPKECKLIIKKRKDWIINDL